MTRVSKPAVLQRPQSAVHRSLMVERGAAAKVAGVDERRLKPAARRVVGSRQTMDPAADHEEVERGRGERIEVARTHEGVSFYSRAPSQC